MPTIPGQYACSDYAIEYAATIAEDARLGSVRWVKPDGAVIVFDFYANTDTTLNALRRFALEHVDDYRREDHPGDWKYKNEPARWEIYNRMRGEVLAYVAAAIDALQKREYAHGTQGQG